MNRATDYGYVSDSGYLVDTRIRVYPGLVVRHRSAEGVYDLSVYRTHRDMGYWECVWQDGPRRGSIWVRHERDILADAYAP